MKWVRGIDGIERATLRIAFQITRDEYEEWRRYALGQTEKPTEGLLRTHLWLYGNELIEYVVPDQLIKDEREEDREHEKTTL